MSPLTKETVPNRAITGTEAAKLMADDLAAVLARDGVFGDHIAFPELAYKVTVEVHMNNPAYPTHQVLVHSRPKPGQNESVKPFPMTQETEKVPDEITGEEVEQEKVVGIVAERSRKVTNPNKERIKRAMPITVTRPNREGHFTDEKVVYDKNSLPEEELDTSIGAKDADGEELGKLEEKKRKEWGWDKK